MKYYSSVMKCIRQYLIPWASLGLLCLGGPMAAETIHISHCRQACPEVSNPGHEILVRHLYVASVNRETGLAEWVAYRVLDEALGVASLLPRRWQEDELLRAGGAAVNLEGHEGPRVTQPDLSDAQDSEYRINEVLIDPEDRGRLAPMTSFAGTPYWEELNNLSNMAPLPPDLRLGSWARLEQRINELARTGRQLYVVSGPISKESSTDGTGEAYFKVVRGAGTEAAFVFPAGLAINADYCDQLSTRREVERLLDLTLFPGQSPATLGSMTAALGCAADD